MSEPKNCQNITDLDEVQILVPPQATARVAAGVGKEGHGRFTQLLLALIILAFSQIIFRARGGGIFAGDCGWKTLRAIPVRERRRDGSFWFVRSLSIILRPLFFGRLGLVLLLNQGVITIIMMGVITIIWQHYLDQTLAAAVQTQGGWSARRLTETQVCGVTPHCFLD